MPEISVVIPTYEGAKRILIPLKSLEKQTYKDFEVILIIDGSTDDTEIVVQQAKLNLTIKVVVKKNGGRSNARNAGLDHCLGNYIIFFDDDVEIPADTVMQYHQLRNSYSIIQGDFYPLYNAKSEFVDYCYFLNSKWSKNLPETGFLSYPYLSAANFMISKKLFESVDGFNNQLKDVEDMDLAIRIMEKGERIYFSSSLKVGHIVQLGFRKYADRLCQYAEAREVLKHINPKAENYLNSHGAIKSYKKFIYKILPASWLISWMDKNYFTFLPVSIRYKLYSIFITAYTLKH